MSGYRGRATDRSGRRQRGRPSTRIKARRRTASEPSQRAITTQIEGLSKLQRRGVGTHVGRDKAVQEQVNGGRDGQGDRTHTQGRTQLSQFTQTPARSQVSARIAITKHVRDD